MQEAQDRIIEAAGGKPKRKRSKVGVKVKYPDVSVQLVGKDGNAFSIMGAVTRELRRNGHVDGIDEFMKEAQEQESYDAFLQVVMRTVNVR